MILIIRSFFLHSEHKPIFEPSDNFFILKLPNLNYSDPVNDPVYDEFNDFELAIIKIIKNNPGSNAPKILELVSKEFLLHENISIQNGFKKPNQKNKIIIPTVALLWRAIL